MIHERLIVNDLVNSKWIVYYKTILNVFELLILLWLARVIPVPYTSHKCVDELHFVVPLSVNRSS